MEAGSASTSDLTVTQGLRIFCLSFISRGENEKNVSPELDCWMKNNQPFTCSLLISSSLRRRKKGRKDEAQMDTSVVPATADLLLLCSHTHSINRNQQAGWSSPLPDCTCTRTCMSCSRSLSLRFCLGFCGVSSLVLAQANVSGFCESQLKSSVLLAFAASSVAAARSGLEDT